MLSLKNSARKGLRIYHTDPSNDKPVYVHNCNLVNNVAAYVLVHNSTRP